MSKDVDKVLGSRKQPGLSMSKDPLCSVTHAHQHSLKEVETSDSFGEQADSEDVRSDCVCRPKFCT